MSDTLSARHGTARVLGGLAGHLAEELECGGQPNRTTKVETDGHPRETEGQTSQQVLADSPDLEPEDIGAAWDDAAAAVQERELPMTRPT